MSWRKKIKSLLHNLTYLKQERGAVFVLTALLLPVLFGFMGFAYDVGNLYMHKARLQNVTDAAALAGGSVFGEMAQGTDEKKGTVITLTNTHTEADNVAKDYIKKNERNLGNQISVEELSALAYEPSVNKDNKTQVITQDTDVYYRVIASEKVPLYFIPLVINNFSQEVRTVSVALTKTKKVTTPGSETGGSGDGEIDIPNSSIFDNLFTYSEFFDTGLATTSNTINSTFKGNMVFTYGNSAGTENDFYDMTAIIPQLVNGYVDHLFTSDNVDLADVKANGNSTGWGKVNDPIINTYFNTTAYVDVFTNMLKGPHVNVKKDSLTADNINDYDSDLYNSFIKIDGHMVFKGRTYGTPYLFINNIYYACDLNTNDYVYLKDAEHTVANRITYYNYDNKFFPVIKEGNRSYLINERYEKTNCFIENSNFKLVYTNENEEQQIKNLEYDNNQKKLFYRNNYGHQIFIDTAAEGDPVRIMPAGTALPKPDAFDPQTTGSDYYKTKIESNVFYVSSEFQNNVKTTTIDIQKPITVGNVNDPIYIIIGESISGEATSVKLKIANNTRPIIVVYLGTKNILLEGDKDGVAKLTVYAPFGTFGGTQDNEQINYAGTFKGNVIARHVAIQAGGSGHWEVENHLKNNKEVQKIDKQIETAIKSKQLTDTVKTAVANAYAPIFGEEAADFKNMLFRDEDESAENSAERKKQNQLSYSKLSYAKKQELYTAWKGLVETYPDFKDLLWPWNDHFDLDLSQQPITTDPTTTSTSTLRLINPRTEQNPYFDGDPGI